MAVYPVEPFIPGLKLSQMLYDQAVQPILAAHFPRLVYSAAHLGAGSDVLGFDTPRSTDHGWGPKLGLFVSEADYVEHKETIVRTFSEHLPYEIGGYPTNFAASTDGGWMQPISSGPINHGVQVSTVRRFFAEYLNLDPYAELSATDWLLLPQQLLRTIVAGRVFHDGLGELEPVRARFHYYPRDVWLYLLASQWRRIDQDEPFMGRCGDVGDDLGSRLVAARLVRDLMRLCFLMERTYIPYSKWFGTAFARLECAAELAPIFERVLQAEDWKAREEHLSQAYEKVARMHNALEITEPLPTQVSTFFDRPYLVIHSGDFVDAIRAAIADEEVKRLPVHLGSIDQFVDSTDVLGYHRRSERLRAMYKDE
jgi:Domain of unknown function (DUF4037)